MLSAVFGVTNRLLQCVQYAETGDRVRLARERSALLDGHVALLRSVCPASPARAAHEAYLHATLAASVDDVCREVLGAGVASAHQRDVASSVGERWSTRIMQGHLGGALGRAVHAVDAIDLVVTDGVSGDAKPLLPETTARCAALLRPALDAGAIGLVPGFYGADAGGRLATLGRGGSDLTAAVLGFCLDAREIQLYKVEYTVDAPTGWMRDWAPGWVGIAHCADPAVTIPSLHYEEARELAHFAKKVLHPETVSPAVEKGIPILVRNSHEPGLAGTRIVGGGVASAPPRILTCTRTPLRDYERKHSPLLDLPLSWLGVDRESAYLVALVGLNIMELPGLAQRATAALRGAGIRCFVPKRVNGSAHSFSMIVPTSERESALKVLHGALVLPPP